jgi:hypothetical protein
MEEKINSPKQHRRQQQAHLLNLPPASASTPRVLAQPLRGTNTNNSARGKRMSENTPHGPSRYKTRKDEKNEKDQKDKQTTDV